MSLHCFFGLAMRVDGVPVTPPMPPNSSLVLSHCALTSIAAGAVTLYAQSHDQPQRFAICTLSPDHGVYYAPLQLVFTQKVSFTLVSFTGAAGESSANNNNKRQKDRRESDGTHDAAGAPAAVVHLTGYFESDEDHLGVGADDDDEDDAGEAVDGDDDSLQDTAGAGRKRGRSDGDEQRREQQKPETSRGGKSKKGNKEGNHKTKGKK